MDKFQTINKLENIYLHDLNSIIDIIFVYYWFFNILLDI